MYIGQIEPLRAKLFREEASSRIYYYQGHGYHRIGYIANPFKIDERIKLIFKCFLLTIAVICTIGCYSTLRQRLHNMASDAWHNRKLMPVYRLCPPVVTPYKEIQLQSFPILTVLEFSPGFFHEQEKKEVADACQRVRKALLEQGNKEKLELTYGRKDRNSRLRDRLFLDLLVEYFQQLATTPFSKIPTGYDTLSNHMEDIIIQRYFDDPTSKKIFLDLMKELLSEIPSPIKERIADNIGQSFFGEYMGKLGDDFPFKQDFCKFLQSLTSHKSPTQLMLSILIDNAERLQACLDNGISPYIHLRDRIYSKSHFPLLQLAIELNSHRSVDLLLTRVYHSFDDNVLWQFRLSPEIFKVLWSKEIPLYDNIPSQNILATLYEWKNLEAFRTVLNVKPQFLLLKRPKHPSLMEEMYAHISKTVPDQLPYFEAAFNAYTTILNKPLSASILADMQERILQGESRWLPFLPAGERAAMEKMAKGRESPLARMTEMRLKLARELLRHNLDPENIDGELIYSAYLLKKEIKNLLKSPENASLHEEYRTFVDVYDTVTRRHPLWSMLKEHSRNFRKGVMLRRYDEADPRDQFFNLVDIPLTFVSSKDKTTERAAVWRTNAAMIHRRALIGFAQQRRRLEHERCITLMHGTKSPTVAIISRTADYAIKPSGAIHCTLGGEGSQAIAGVNVHSVSTIGAAREWGIAPGFFGYESHFAVALGYACNEIAEASFGYRTVERPLTFNPKNEMEIIAKATAEILKGETTNPAMENPFWFDFKRAIKRLKLLENKEFMECSSSLREKLEKFAKENYIWSSDIEECLKLWNETPSVTLDPTNPLLTTTYPALFTSSQFREEDMKRFHATPSHSNKGEILIRGAIPIGTKGGDSITSSGSTLIRTACAFDTVFTTLEGVPVLEAHLKEKGVTVLTLDAFRVQAMMQMSMVARTAFRKHEEDTKISFSDICMDFHQYVLPGYARPFPMLPATRDPFYGYGSPSYTTYIAEVEAGTRLPRDIHGAMHSSRVALFALMCMNIYASVGKKLNVSESVLVMAAGAHDIARQDEGPDRWDADSGKWMRWFADRVLHISDKETLDNIEDALAHKDSSEPEYETVLQGCVQGGDCIDIIRCIDSPLTRFRFRLLKFVNLPELAEFPREKALREWVDFITLTQDEALRMHMEHYSQNYLWDLFLIFKELHGGKRFPIMYQHLKSQCERVTGSLPEHYAPFMKSLKEKLS